MALGDGKRPRACDPVTILAIERFNDVQLCEKFGWTPDIIRQLPNDYYEDLKDILKIKAEKAAQRAASEEEKFKHGSK